MMFAGGADRDDPGLSWLAWGGALAASPPPRRRRRFTWRHLLGALVALADLWALLVLAGVT